MKNIINSIKNWIAVDGLLHMLACYAIMITFGWIDLVAGVILTAGVAFFKESYDKAFKKATTKEIVHDVICDAIGLVVALLAILILV